MPELDPIAQLDHIPGLWLVLQIGVSLIAIFALGWLARILQLGGDPRIADEAHARALADDAVCGFNARAVVLDRARVGALVRDARDRVMLIRQHGSNFAAREITSYAGIRLDGRFLTITTQDKRFGTVTLDLGDQAQVWAASLRRLGSAA